MEHGTADTTGNGTTLQMKHLRKLAHSFKTGSNWNGCPWLGVKLRKNAHAETMQIIKQLGWESALYFWKRGEVDSCHMRQKLVLDKQ